MGDKRQEGEGTGKGGQHWKEVGRQGWGGQRVRVNGNLTPTVISKSRHLW